MMESPTDIVFAVMIALNTLAVVYLLARPRQIVHVDALREFWLAVTKIRAHGPWTARGIEDALADEPETRDDG